MTKKHSNVSTDWAPLPRNLTARADYVVRGNPPVTRPESGVDNCYPGLEFDQRNLDKKFFPGLVFEFYRDDGANLRSVGPDNPINEQDLNVPLYLWGMKGAVNADSPNPETMWFTWLDGLSVWRHVHALLPGKVAVLIGAGAGVSTQPLPEAKQALESAFDSGQSTVHRNGQGELAWAVLVGERARYLDGEGVIDPDAYQPGELTQSLCAPWAYDFRDCGCFYWASNKPDVVSDETGKYPALNFQRKNWDRDPQIADMAGRTGRREQELDYTDLINKTWKPAVDSDQPLEGWNQLRVVVNGRERGGGFSPSPGPQLAKFMHREEVAREIHKLAEVEHAVAVEYLFAYYSIDAPLALEKNNTDQPLAQRWRAARTLFDIAVDEMRHLRWANELLRLLGQPPSLGRAIWIREDMKRPLRLRACTPAQLQSFIDLERPSQSTATGLDGLYVGVLESIKKYPDEYDDPDTLIEIVKLIIDEGEGHYERFCRIQRTLSVYPNAGYLRGNYGVGDNRETTIAPPHSRQREKQTLGDKYYADILEALQASFLLGHKASGRYLNQAIASMYMLNDLAFNMAAQGTTLLFTRVDIKPVVKSVEAIKSRMNESYEKLQQALTHAATESREDEAMIENHQQRFAKRHEAMVSILEES